VVISSNRFLNVLNNSFYNIYNYKMKIGLIIYHKNIFSYIDSKIVFKCLESIENQTFKDFDILELDYSDYNQYQTTIMKVGFLKNNKRYFFRQECKNHIEAMNFLLNKAFNEMNYDIIYNINLDDIYDKHRFEFQLRKILIDGYDLVGSNYEIFQNKNGNEISRSIKIVPEFEDIIDEQTYLKIKNSQKKCVIQLSSMCFTKESWEIIKNIDILPTLESLLICKKLLKKDKKIHICKEKLLRYRIHSQQVSRKYRRENI